MLGGRGSQAGHGQALRNMQGQAEAGGGLRVAASRARQPLAKHAGAQLRARRESIRGRPPPGAWAQARPCPAGGGAGGIAKGEEQLSMARSSVWPCCRHCTASVVCGLPQRQLSPSASARRGRRCSPHCCRPYCCRLDHWGGGSGSRGGDGLECEEPPRHEDATERCLPTDRAAPHMFLSFIGLSGLHRDTCTRRSASRIPRGSQKSPANTWRSWRAP